MDKRVKFLGLDVLFSLVTVMAAAVCSIIQCFGSAKFENSDNYDIFLVDMKFNWFAYILGTALFILFLYYSHKKYLKRYYEEYPVEHPAVVIMHFIISVVFAFAMFVTVIFAPLILLGFDKNFVPELLAFITIFVWPVVFLLYMNATLSFYLIVKKKTGKSKKKKK